MEKLSSGAKRNIADDTKTGSSSVSLSQDSTVKVTCLLDSQVSVFGGKQQPRCLICHKTLTAERARRKQSYRCSKQTC